MRKRAIAVALALALSGLAAPARALWSQTRNATLPVVALGQVAFAAIPQGADTGPASGHGEPVPLELTETILTELLTTAEADGKPAVWRFTIAGRADGTRGLDYHLAATATGGLPFHISPASPDETCPEVTTPGAGGRVAIDAPGPVSLQPPGPPGTRAPVTEQQWCVTIPPVLVGAYVSAAERAPSPATRPAPCTSPPGAPRRTTPRRPLMSSRSRVLTRLGSRPPATRSPPTGTAPPCTSTSTTAVTPPARSRSSARG